MAHARARGPNESTPRYCFPLFNRTAVPARVTDFRDHQNESAQRYKPGRRLSLFRRLQVLTDEFNKLFNSFHLEIHVVLIAIVSLRVYGSVRTEGLLAFVQTYMGSWMLVLHLQLCNSYGVINHGSEMFFRAIWASCAGSCTLLVTGSFETSGISSVRAIRRQLRSVRVLCITEGSSTFRYDKRLVLTVVQIVLSQAVTLLLLY